MYAPVLNTNLSVCKSICGLFNANRCVNFCLNLLCRTQLELEEFSTCLPRYNTLFNSRFTKNATLIWTCSNIFHENQGKYNSSVFYKCKLLPGRLIKKIRPDKLVTQYTGNSVCSLGAFMFVLLYDSLSQFSQFGTVIASALIQHCVVDYV